MKLTTILSRVIIFVLVINLLAAIAAAPIVFAQEARRDGPQDTQTQDSQNLRLYLFQHTQNPQDKSIKMDLIINSQVNSDRVQLTWFISDGPSQWLQIADQKITQVRTIKQDLTLKANQQYIFSQLLQPLNRGTTQILIQVESFAADGRILATVSKPVWTDANVNALVLSGNFLITPDEYKLAQYLNYLRIFSIAGIILVVGYYLVVYGYSWLQRWLKKD